MKTKVIQTRLFPDNHFIAITLFGLVFTHDRGRVDRMVLRHELIHCQQQLEWLYLPFFVLYIIEYLWYLMRYRDSYKAYRSISFEREAYDHEHEIDYLRRRRLWATYRKKKYRKVRKTGK